ncbi:hypothetical protein [Fuerstiella marisgermanici]|uniref:Uncharacterized protein n=1 Tax=Fuerstiella marisgermanici TaxID=1891926 RepID=A0A1P8WCT2_9PLAN|nr:hypothetical protein [Fuerstiella marisgermanici]APZ91865.1 hypothetical protein Fuma_01461 [Fuerstiella marisgermanici]
MKSIIEYIRATVVVCACCLVLQAVADAQSSRSRQEKEDVLTDRELEMRLSKAEDALVSEYKDVAMKLYNQGDKEKSMAMLRRLKELNPRLEGLGDQIKQINEELMDENANEFDLDTKKPWESIGEVSEDKPFRIQSSGEFKMTFNATVTVDGLKPDKESKDYLPGAPLGCLLGVIVTDGKPGKPFPVKSQLEHTPKKGGTLFLKVNVPEGTRCLGRIKVKVSGYIQTSRR